MRIFVGNLPFSTDDEELREVFSNHGQVTDAKVIMDRDDRSRSRGFGFVEMPNNDEATKAIAAMDGSELHGRSINVNEARQREDRGGDRRRSRR
jgi:RNA recognition motif-containing protein